MKLLCTNLFLFSFTLLIWGQDNISVPSVPNDSSMSYDQKNTLLEERISWHKMFTNIPLDYYKFFGSGKGIGNTSLLLKTILLSGALIPVDQNAYDFQTNLQGHNSFIKKGSEYAVFIGDGKFNLITAGLFSLYGFALGDTRALKTSSNIIESVISTGLLVQALKRMFGRESPAVASHNTGKWDLFPNPKKYDKNPPRYYAFPSGHISTLTTTVTVIANNYPEISWIKPVGYSAIALVGISLVNKGMHWYSDLPLGIYLGYSLGNIIAPKRDLSANMEKSHFLFFPIMTVDNNPGLGVIYNF